MSKQFWLSLSYSAETYPFLSEADKGRFKEAKENITRHETFPLSIGV
ncbi:hypothetical protein [Blautia wexlerae]|nr:hypothetical protein [Blautia wexlerae]